MARKIKVVGGLQRVSRPMYPSEPGYVAAMNRQCKALEVALQDVFDQVEDISTEIMMDALRPTLQLAQYYTPKKTGDLVESGYLEPTGSAKLPRVEIGFGHGGNPRYTMYVHEIMEYNHAAPTRAKFLQSAVMEDQHNIYERLVAGYQEAFNG